MTTRTWLPSGWTCCWAVWGVAGMMFSPTPANGQADDGGAPEVDGGIPAVRTSGETSVVLSGSPEQLERILAVLRQFEGIRVAPTRYGPSAHPYDLNEPYDPGSPLQRAPHPHPFSGSSSRRYRSDYNGRGYGSSYGGYGYDYGYRGSYDSGFEAGYRQGHFYGRREMEAELSAPLFVSNYQFTMQTGTQDFRAGDYSSAARHFILAARLDNGDASSRIRGGHALVAVGRYHEASTLIARALQLQPKLPYLTRDIRDEYGQKDDFARHFEQLGKATRDAGDQADLWALLGYYEFFGGRQTEALQSLSKAETLDPRNGLAQRLLEVARLSVPPVERDSSD